MVEFSGPARLKRSTKGLDVIQAVFAFAMALGLTDVYDGSRTFINDILLGTRPVTDQRAVLTGLLLANVIMLGLRFFWVPRNLHALVFVAAQYAKTGFKEADVPLSHLNIAFHLVMVVLHGAVYFLVCAEFKFIAFLASSSLPLNTSIFTEYVILHIWLLLMNAAWIGLIKLQESNLEKTAVPVEGYRNPSAGSVWWRNNLISSLVALAPFAVFETCQSNIGRCLAQPGTIGPHVANLLPVGPIQLAQIFNLFSDALNNFGDFSRSSAVLWALLVLMFNSLYDLLNTGRYYLFFEEAEWESSSK